MPHAIDRHRAHADPRCAAAGYRRCQVDAGPVRQFSLHRRRVGKPDSAHRAKAGAVPRSHAARASRRDGGVASAHGRDGVLDATLAPAGGAALQRQRHRSRRLLPAGRGPELHRHRRRVHRQRAARRSSTEYSHFLVSNSVRPLSPWANEGLAEVYEMVQDRERRHEGRGWPRPGPARRASDGQHADPDSRADRHRPPLAGLQRRQPAWRVLRAIVGAGALSQLRQPGARETVLVTTCRVCDPTASRRPRSPRRLAPTPRRSTASCSSTCGDICSPPSCSTSARRWPPARCRVASRSTRSTPTSTSPTSRAALA